jgi:hypothetical protein
MLHDGATIQLRKGGAKLAGRSRACAQEVEDRASRRVPQRAEDAVLRVESPNHVILI